MLQKGGFMATKKQEQQAELQPKFVRVCGTVTDMMYGRRTYNNGRKDKEDKFRLSIKPADGEMEKLIKEAIPYYENADANYIPKFLKDDASDEDLEYLNLKSSFEFPFAKLENGKIVGADYSQIELRLLAHISGDETMINAFTDGVDIHTVTASQVFNTPLEFVTPEQRKRAKAVNFGIIYGMGDFSLASDIKVTKKQAGEYIQSYFEKYPKVDEYLKNVVEQAKIDGFVTTLYGRRRYIPDLKSGKAVLRKFGERVAMNSPIQGTAADIIKIAMINTERALSASGIDARLILQVHDELIIEANVNCAEKAKEILQREMENAVKLSVPLTVEIANGKTWFECK